MVTVVVVKKKKSGGMWKGVNKQQLLFLDSCCEEIHLFECLYEIIIPLYCSISAFFIYLIRHKFLQYKITFGKKFCILSNSLRKTCYEMRIINYLHKLNKPAKHEYHSK